MAETTYTFFRNDQHVANFPFDPSDPACLDSADYRFYGRVLNILAPQIKDLGLSVYVTGWTVHELPAYGPNVISLILQDEWAREPAYRDKVGMIFKTCGLSPIRLEAYKFGTAVDRISNFLAQSKAAAKDGAGRIKTGLKRLAGKKIAPVYEIPLGCYACDHVPFVKIRDRKNDLFFAGSVQHVQNSYLPRPKELARQRMGRALRDLKEKNQKISIKNTITGSFYDSIHNSNKAYLEEMSHTKICPIPRGANLETFRFYEAIRYGCIPIGEAFPNNEIYNDAPIVRLRDWSQLSEVVPALLADEVKVEELHTRALAWWESVCSEKAIAGFLAKRIRDHYIGKV